MKQIKLLILCGYGCEHDIHLPQGLESFPDELRHFQWNFYPLKSLPSNFHPDNPDVLDMSESQIERLWTGIQDLSNLKAIILDGWLSNLEKINCQDSVCLTEVPASIANLDKLVDMNFRHCRKITSVPCRRSIKCIDLLGCSNHEKFPEVGDIEYLEFTGTIFEGESSATALHHGNIQRASIWPEELDLIKRTRLPQLQGYAKVDNQGELERHSIGICHHDSFPFFNHSKLEQEKIADFWHVIYQRIQFVGAALLFPKEISTFPLGSFGCYHQSEGSSITIQLPQNWLRDEFVGFTVLAILSLEDSNGSDDYFYSRWECQFNSACGESKRVSIQLRHLPFEYGSSYFTSETQLVSDDWLYESEWNKATFDAYLETSCAKPCYKLKYILIRLMYIGDVVENPPVTQPSYSYDPSKMSLTFSFNKAEGTSIGRDLDDYHNDEKDNGKRRFDAEGTERQVIVSSPHSKEQNKGKDKILTTQGTQQSSSNQMCISNKLRKDESIEEEDEVESGYSEDHEAQEETLFMDTVVDHHFLNSTSYNHSFNTVDAQSCVFKSLAPSLECEASSSSGQAPFCILEDASLEQFNNPLESLDLSFLDLTSVVPSFTSLEEPSSPEEVEPAKTKLMEILTIKLPDLSVEQRDVALGAIKILLRSPSHTLETTRARELTEKIKAARERDQELRNRILKLQGQINMLYEEIDILKQEAYSNKNLADTTAQEWHANSKDLQTLAASIETECPMAQKWSHQRQQWLIPIVFMLRVVNLV
ncbi:hypothetical protein GH714_039622 [Hevea brasiliensis]|uniref:C-JID domain-containing protein n=1 Tax=Hevea brasiliensis TaxID=3981 RepID=A0A6A6MJI7_HEVBR|nr:hypothetical protein GH714_039622 [Hevea brasiliensis]